MGMKGIVSALGMSSEGVLAAGTFSRWIGLYDGYGRGGTIGVFETKGSQGVEKDKWAGAGIIQLSWSTCGRYLCVVERESDGIGVWDIRGSGKRLAWLQGRYGKTNQRLETGLVGGEIWAGGTDGLVRIWEGLGLSEGDLNPTWQFQAHDGISSPFSFPFLSFPSPTL
jgi:telomerase Cajal body protein 1